MNTQDFKQKMEEQDKKIKEMEERLGQPWQTAVLEMINAPCADAINKLWEDVIYAQRGRDYGTWQYPGQAYRHLWAEYQDMQTQREKLLAACRAVLEWAQAPGSAPNGDFTYFAEQLVPMLDEVVSSVTPPPL